MAPPGHHGARHHARHLARRDVIGAAVAAGVVPRHALAADTPDALLAWLRTLVADETAAGLTAAGVRAHPFFAAQDKLLKAGLAWLDIQARAHGVPGFAALPAEARAKLAMATQMAGDHSLQRGFFTVTRAIAFDLYYTDPAAWAGIPGYRGPPQPEGYPDHAAPPG